MLTRRRLAVLKLLASALAPLLAAHPSRSMLTRRRLAVLKLLASALAVLMPVLSWSPYASPSVD
jgi:hypothetical protein